MDDDSAALCPKSDGTGSVRKYGEYGYLYLLSPGTLADTYLLPVKKKRTRTDWELDAIWRPRVERWRENGRCEVGRLAVKIGVSLAALRELETGWDGRAWTIPERNGTGLIVGVSRRFEDGAKRCAVGSRRGLTYSDGWNGLQGPVLIVEGASDVAAGITLGLSTIGRPSNTGGKDMLVQLLRSSKQKLIVVGERDQKEDGRWPGMEGCRSVASGLSKALRRDVIAKLLPDDAKDLRVWLRGQSVDLRNAKVCCRTGQLLLARLNVV